jgi:hypothetical protein
MCTFRVMTLVHLHSKHWVSFPTHSFQIKLTGPSHSAITMVTHLCISPFGMVVSVSLEQHDIHNDI